MAPIEPKHSKSMHAMARVINEQLNGPPGTKPKYGFFLAVFPFYDVKGRFNYISNANRRDIIVLLKEMTARFEEQPESSERTQP